MAYQYCCWTVSLVPIDVLSYDSVTSANVTSLRQAASRTGIAIREIEPHRLGLQVDPTGAQALLDGKEWNPQAVLHRTVWQLLELTEPVLEQLAKNGTTVINPIECALIARDKARAAVLLNSSGVPTVPTVAVASGSSGPLPRQPEAGPWRVSKPANGVRGIGVYLHDTTGALQSHIAELPKDGSIQVVQPCWGEPGTDLRAFIVDGECIALMQRYAQPGVFTANLAQGGRGRALDPKRHPASELAVAATGALGLDYAGVDIVGYGNNVSSKLAVLEVNAWAGWAGIEDATGVLVSDAILKLAAKRAGV